MSPINFEKPCSDVVLLHRLTVGDNWDAGDMTLLSAAEQARMKDYKNPLRAARFCMARTALRKVLAQRMRCDPAWVQLLQTVHGKPYAPDLPQMHFSVSYDRQHAFVALCHSRILGLDVQHLSPRQLDTLSQFIRDGGGSPEVASNPAHVWTRMEAYAKMIGRGLNAGPRFLLAVALGQSSRAMPHRFLETEFGDTAVSICVEGTAPVRMVWECNATMEKLVKASAIRASWSVFGGCYYYSL